jgi:hypothetical protein
MSDDTLARIGFAAGVSDAGLGDEEGDEQGCGNKTQAQFLNENAPEMAGVVWADQNIFCHRRLIHFFSPPFRASQRDFLFWRGFIYREEI